MKVKIGVCIGLLVVIFISALIFLNQKEPYDMDSLPTVNYWELFARITKERRYMEEAGAYYLMPIFTAELNALEGQEIAVRGYYLPNLSLDTVLVISRFNNANCFFCGQAGIESVAMALLSEPRKINYEIDQRLTVKGKLTLNSSDIGKLAFVLDEADVIDD